MKKKVSKATVTKIPSKKGKVVKKLDGITGKEKPVLTEGYKDPYSKKIYASEKAYVEMKLGHPKAKYTILFNSVLELVKKDIKEKAIEVSSMGLDWVDKRLPSYALHHMRLFDKNAESYKIVTTPVKEFKKDDVNETKVKGLLKFTLIKRDLVKK